jgi:hypothetical protein
MKAKRSMKIENEGERQKVGEIDRETEVSYL